MADKVIIGKDIVKDTVRTFAWDDASVEVKRFLPFNDAVGFVNDVVAGCLDDSGSYMPEALDFMRRYEFIAYYTNIELPDGTLDKYAILYGTDLYAQIYELVDLDQLDVLWAVINERINMIKDDARAEISKQIAGVVSTMENLSNILSETVGDLTSDQITEFLKVVASGTVDEGKIVSALMDAKEHTNTVSTKTSKEVKVS